MAINPNSNKKVLVALSGGVDSAVSASLLKDQGYSVEGAHMVCWNEGPDCTSDQDRSDATKVAAHLNIPFQVFDFRKEYSEQVVSYFYSEYEAGRTPNPDVACNREIKFGIFLNKALELGFDYIATGHYAWVGKSKVKSKQELHSIESEKSKLHNLDNQSLEQFRLLAAFDLSKDQSLAKYKLCAGADPDKDQSYFLYNLTQDQLSHTVFPIGHLRKTEVRQIAVKLNLPNAAKKDSQGICFIGDVDMSEFLQRKVKVKYGKVVTPSGVVIGKHKGLAYYTIGQREGVGVSQKIPHYVVSKDKRTNTIVAAPFNDETHYKLGIQVERVNWVGEKPKVEAIIQARIRYRQPLFDAKIKKLGSKDIEVEFLEPQKAVTPGQSAVFYQKSVVLGGGTII